MRYRQGGAPIAEHGGRARFQHLQPTARLPGSAGGRDGADGRGGYGVEAASTLGGVDLPLRRPTATAPSSCSAAPTSSSPSPPFGPTTPPPTSRVVPAPFAHHVAGSHATLFARLRGYVLEHARDLARIAVAAGQDSERPLLLQEVVREEECGEVLEEQWSTQRRPLFLSQNFFKETDLKLEIKNMQRQRRV